MIFVVLGRRWAGLPDSEKSRGRIAERSTSPGCRRVLAAAAQPVRSAKREFEGLSSLKRRAWKPARRMIDECDRERKRNCTRLHASRFRLGVIISAAAPPPAFFAAGGEWAALSGKASGVDRQGCLAVQRWNWWRFGSARCRAAGESVGRGSSRCRGSLGLPCGRRSIATTGQQAPVKIASDVAGLLIRITHYREKSGRPCGASEFWGTGAYVLWKLRRATMAAIDWCRHLTSAGASHRQPL